MLSHMVGSSNRIDIVRLRTLEHELAERDEKIARQEARLSENARERSELSRKVELLEAEARRRDVADGPPTRWRRMRRRLRCFCSGWMQRKLIRVR